MKRSGFQIYALLVCFVTLVCSVVALGIAMYSILEIAKPEFTVSGWEHDKHRDNDTFWALVSGKGSRPFPPGLEEVAEGGKAGEIARPAEADLTKRREASLAAILSNEKRGGAQTLVQCLIVLFINIVAFALHWVLARRVQAALG